MKENLFTSAGDFSAMTMFELAMYRMKQINSSNLDMVKAIDEYIDKIKCETASTSAT